MNENINDDLIMAAAHIYAWISASDGDLEKEESFRSVLKNFGIIDDKSIEQFMYFYKYISKRFINDFKGTMIETREVIKKFREDRKSSTKLIEVARLAIVADGALDTSEDNIMLQLEEILKIKDSNIS